MAVFLFVVVGCRLLSLLKYIISFFLLLDQVAEIQDKMRNGYYIRQGLSSVKDDISRMCRDAIK